MLLKCEIHGEIKNTSYVSKIFWAGLSEFKNLETDIYRYVCINPEYEGGTVLFLSSEDHAISSKITTRRSASNISKIMEYIENNELYDGKIERVFVNRDIEKKELIDRIFIIKNRNRLLPVCPKCAETHILALSL